MVCEILTTPQDDLWAFQLRDGRGIEYLDLWRRLDADPTVDEVIRNFVVRQPLLWMSTSDATPVK